MPDRLGAGILAGPFGQGDPDRLRALLAAAGSASVTVTTRELVVVFPSRAQYVDRAAASMAQLLPELAALDGAGRSGPRLDLAAIGG